MFELPLSLRVAIRGIRRRPWGPAIATLTLGIAVGTLGVMMAATYDVALRPLPYPHPDRLVVIRQRADLLTDADVQLAANARSFRDVGSFAAATLSFQSGSDIRRVSTAAVDSGFVSALGVGAERGRELQPSDFELGAPRAIVVSHTLAEQLAPGRSVIGALVTLDGTAFTIVGVMPRAYEFPAGTDIWVPRHTLASFDGSAAITALARLADQATMARAEAELSVLSRSRTEPTLTGMRFEFEAGAFVNAVRGDTRPAFWLLATGVALLFLVTVGTLANLALVRAAVRTREVVVHAALGASATQLFQQQVAESSVVSVGGSAIGLALAVAATRVLPTLPVSVDWWPRELSVDWRVVIALGVIGGGVTLLLGLIPVVQFRGLELQNALRNGAAGITANRTQRRFRAALLGAELSLVTFLVICGGILIKQSLRIDRVQWGYDAEHIAVGFVALPGAEYAPSDARARVASSTVERVRAMPGVRAATAFGETWLLQKMRRGHPGIDVDSYAGHARGGPALAFESIDTDSEYFATMGVPILRGRGLSVSDNASALPVVVVDEAFADANWPGQSAIGHRIRFPAAEPGGPWYTIVGVVGRAAGIGPFAQMREPGRMWTPTMVYRSRRQVALFARADQSSPAAQGFALAVRPEHDIAAGAAAMRRAAGEVLPGFPVEHIGSLKTYFEGTAGAPRVRETATTLVAFAAFGVLLCLVGVVGIVVDSVSRRTREIGIRVALGAQARDVVALVMHDSTIIAAAGIVAGLAVSLALSRIIGHFIFVSDVTSADPYAGPLTIADPSVVLAAALGILAVVLAAGLWPARRALAIDPATALRVD